MRFVFEQYRYTLSFEQAFIKEPALQELTYCTIEETSWANSYTGEQRKRMKADGQSTGWYW